MGSETEAGFGLGAGLARRIGGRTSVEAMADYHRVRGTPDSEFLTYQVGLVRKLC